MRIMKNNLKILLLTVFLAAASCSFTTKKFEDPDKDKLLIDLITYVLQRGHYNPADLNDAFSEKVYNDFIKGLDPIKRYFLASDIEEFSKYKDKIDDQLKSKDLSFFNLVYDRLQKRMLEAQDIYTEVLDKPFDYSAQESIDVNYDEVPYASNKKELKERWRQQLKFSTIASYYDMMEDKSTLAEESSSTMDEIEAIEQKDQINSMTAAETSETDSKPKTEKEKEEKSRELSRNSLKEYFEFTKDLERKDYFAIYLTTIVEQFDPHTNYFAPPDRDRFDLRMRGSLEGIGARLQKKNDYINVIEVISGGPAWRGEHLNVGDIILKVRQTGEKEATSIVGMRIDDAVNLIKGPKGTKVNLTIKSTDGMVHEENITRDVVELEETYAKSTLIEKGNSKFGLINLPQFYFNMEDYNKRNAASDVKQEIERLKKEGMEGLVLDLRDNGGGSLRTAVDIAGLFIKDGPVVQVASSGEKKEVLSDEDSSIAWDGPLVILVNELSASASEILAAAMQDYGRAVIIGSEQTYGKGTVQNMIDLNQWLRKSDIGDLGSLKLTTQKFYRVNGGSTQLEGVKSDVIMPDRYSYIDIGERDYANPLPYDKIDAADYTPYTGNTNFKGAILNSKQRMAKSEQLALIDENAKWIKSRRDDLMVNLNYSAYKNAIKEQMQVTKKFDSIDKYDNKLSYKSLSNELLMMKQDTTLAEKRKRWHKNLSKDIYVEEAVNVLEDLETGNIKTGKMADIKK